MPRAVQWMVTAAAEYVVPQAAVIIVRVLDRDVIGQAHQPRGAAGSVNGWMFAHRPSNRQRNRWAVSLLGVQPRQPGPGDRLRPRRRGRGTGPRRRTTAPKSRLPRLECARALLNNTQSPRSRSSSIPRSLRPKHSRSRPPLLFRGRPPSSGQRQEWCTAVHRRRRRWRSSARYSPPGPMCTRSGTTTSGPGNRDGPRWSAAAGRKESGSRTEATCH